MEGRPEQIYSSARGHSNISLVCVGAVQASSPNLRLNVLNTAQLTRRTYCTCMLKDWPKRPWPQSAARVIAPGGCLSGVAGRSIATPLPAIKNSNESWTNYLLLATCLFRSQDSLGARRETRLVTLGTERRCRRVQRPTGWGEEKPLERSRHGGARGWISHFALGLGACAGPSAA
jgi:hypothetical protein